MAYERGKCVIILVCVKICGRKAGIKKGRGKCYEKEEKKKKKQLLNGHFCQLNGTDRGSECRKIFFFLITVKYAWPDFVGSYLTRAHHFIPLSFH